MKESAHKIDLLIETQDDSDATEEGLKIKNNGTVWREVERYEQQLHTLEQLPIFSESEVEKQKYHMHIENTKQDLAKLKPSHPLNIKDSPGPVVCSLQVILKKHRIKEQPYHGGTFTGNHCHRYLTEKVYEQLGDEIVSQTHKLTQNNATQAQAVLIRKQFNYINNLFRQVHIAISHAKPWAKDSYKVVQTHIASYMAAYRSLFPNKVIPKQHILEHHCLQFMRSTGCSLGLLGEQGTEASHQSIGRISSRVLGINNDIDRLSFIMKAHILSVSPSIYSN